MRGASERLALLGSFMGGLGTVHAVLEIGLGEMLHNRRAVRGCPREDAHLVHVGVSGLAQAELCPECSWDDFTFGGDRIIGWVSARSAERELEAAQAVQDGTASWEQCVRVMESTSLTRLGLGHGWSAGVLEAVAELVGSRYRAEFDEHLEVGEGSGLVLVDVADGAVWVDGAVGTLVRVLTGGMGCALLEGRYLEVLKESEADVLGLSAEVPEGHGEVAETALALRLDGSFLTPSAALEAARALASW
jgi:hypothetical protein